MNENYPGWLFKLICIENELCDTKASISSRDHRNTAGNEMERERDVSRGRYMLRKYKKLISPRAKKRQTDLENQAREGRKE